MDETRSHHLAEQLRYLEQTQPIFFLALQELLTTLETARNTDESLPQTTNAAMAIFSAILRLPESLLENKSTETQVTIFQIAAALHSLEKQNTELTQTLMRLIQAALVEINTSIRDQQLVTIDQLLVELQRLLKRVSDDPLD